MFASKNVPIETIFVPMVGLRKLDQTIDVVPKKKRLSYLPIDYRHIEALQKKDYKKLSILLNYVLIKNPEYVNPEKYKSILLFMRSIKEEKVVFELPIPNSKHDNTEVN